MAIEDAAVLALTLALSGGKASDVGLSLQVYQSLRRPRVAASSAAGRQVRQILATPFALLADAFPLISSNKSIGIGTRWQRPARFSLPSPRTFTPLTQR